MIGSLVTSRNLIIGHNSDDLVQFFEIRVLIHLDARVLHIVFRTSRYMIHSREEYERLKNLMPSTYLHKLLRPITAVLILGLLALQVLALTWPHMWRSQSVNGYAKLLTMLLALVWFITDLMSAR